MTRRSSILPSISTVSVRPPEDFFLVVSEVLWHKRLEIALQAARQAKVRLVVVGGGPDLKRLERATADRT